MRDDNRDDKGRFVKGNTARSLGFPKVIHSKLKEALHNAKTDDEILCWWDACNSVDCRETKLNYWCKKVSVFAELKREIQKSIVSRINKGALNHKMNVTGVIWRSKMLGEKDTQYQDVKTKGEVINHNREITKEEADVIRDKLFNNYK